MSDPTLLPGNQLLPAGISTLVDIARRLAELQMTITVPGMDRPGVIHAEPFHPSTTSSALCPFFVNEIKQGISDIGAAGSNPPSGTGQQARDSQFDMLLCVERREGHADLKWGIWDTALWVDTVYATFAMHLKLSHPTTFAVDIPSVVDAKIKAWKMRDIEMNDVTYLAIEFSLTVRERYAQPMKG